MASVYDEYERSLGGKWRKRLSPLAWVAMSVVGLFLLGGIAFAGVAAFALNQAQDVVVDVIESSDEPIVVRLDGVRTMRHELRAMKHELRHELRHAEREALLAKAEAARAISASQIAEDVMRELEQEFEGQFTFSVDGETIELDMFGSEEWAAFSLDVGEKSYSLTIEGEDEGARLILTTPEGESVFKAGDAAETAPSWVPRYPGSAHSDAVFSGEVSGRAGGAELTVTSDSPLAVVEQLTEAFEAEGFDVTVERLSLGHSEVQGSLIGTRESDGKSVAVIIVEEHGETKILTLWGDDTII
jgi:hypothetical protein